MPRPISIPSSTGRHYLENWCFGGSGKVISTTLPPYLSTIRCPPKPLTGATPDRLIGELGAEHGVGKGGRSAHPSAEVLDLSIELDRHHFA